MFLPNLDPKARDPKKLFLIPRQQNQILTLRNACDQKIVWTDRRSGTGKEGPHRSVKLSGSIIEGEGWKLCEKFME